MIDVFIAYSHFDLTYKDELKKFLRPLLREERISLWDDFDIEAGQDWNAKIKERLYGADIVLLLVSADSLASDYFYSKEVKVSLERHGRGEAIVVPVILRHCDWAETPLGSLEALPEKGRPVVEWPTRDQAFQDVVSRLRRVVQSLEQRHLTATAQAEALRQFQAACLAADHLFGKRDWVEARAAYASALAAHQPGFEPDRALLQTRQADCEAQLRAEEVATGQRTKEAEATRSAAEKHAKDTLAAEARGAKEEAVRRQRAEKEQLAQEQRERRAATALPATHPTSRLLIPLGVVGVLIALLFLWSPWSRGGNADQPTGKSPANTEASDFATAKAKGSLPALRVFIQKKYPQEQFEKEAQQLIQSLEIKLNTLLNDAAQFPDDPDTACDLLRQAAAIDPENTQVLKKQKAFNCKVNG